MLARMSPDRLRVWSRGVDAGLFSPNRRSAQLRAEWGASDRRPAILYVGRISRRKGSPCCLFSGRVVGARPQSSAIVAGEVRCNVSSRIVVSTSSPVRSGVRASRRVFASADVFVFPSRDGHRGQCGARSAGVRRAGGEWRAERNLWPHLSGMVCSGRDPHAWADAIVSCARRPRVMPPRVTRALSLSGRWDLALAPLCARRELVSGGRPVRLTPPDPRRSAASQVIALLCRHPWRFVSSRWNYKSAVMSSLFHRARIFFVPTGAGPRSRRCRSSHRVHVPLRRRRPGALTQAFRHVEPARAIAQ